jgi:hypothetical protein
MAEDNIKRNVKDFGLLWKGKFNVQHFYVLPVQYILC